MVCIESFNSYASSDELLLLANLMKFELIARHLLTVVNYLESGGNHTRVKMKVFS